ncbi:MAG TPA: hypothetical protein VFL98_01945 [Candidatus Paceibacterota bacterium]|nr:hypothetical protein [Candidatus Paceibacterota bacterium]
MKLSRTAIILLVIIGIVLIGVAIFGAYQASKGSMNLALAQCLKQKGVTFYGAFWCPHCAQQEANFGLTRDQLSSIGLYTECSTPDGQGQTQVCKDAGIVSYPTWQFPDGTRVEGVQDLAALASKAGCPLPAGASSGSAPGEGGASSVPASTATSS